MALPESLAAVPKLAWSEMSIAQLEQERNFWAAKGTASGDVFARTCQKFIDDHAENGK